MNKGKEENFSQSEQAAGQNKHSSAKRRRGEVLEDAILQAAKNELFESGYRHFTMEAVAKRAKTNKAAVYRRWPGKTKLVIAVLRKYAPKIPDEVPDTGDLRSDLLILLKNAVKPLQAIGAETIHGLLAENFGHEVILSFPRVKNLRNTGKFNSAMVAILKNAELRGEINLEKISPRVISLPFDLLRYEILLTQEPISDETVAEIIDDIFLPLLHSDHS
ncbi:AcrR family transcriptional regulator [Methanomicrobium sp. W14]|uniref:TetR/AcrR family transcriptional regulator n=1 Tax=Methanomicrobium sp. W14 TaxID=2817839 RepID=UPI001AE40771|nr:TetR/AcrR family transcriptional regulator [Methanomicrobium sp. W14]MBP2133285.1 AcrR family transcriptional regulator [Methanomicrobium sp. W14]